MLDPKVEAVETACLKNKDFETLWRAFALAALKTRIAKTTEAIERLAGRAVPDHGAGTSKELGAEMESARHSLMGALAGSGETGLTITLSQLGLDQVCNHYV